MFWKYYFYKSDEQWPILDKGQQNLKQSTLETKKVTLVGQIVSKIPRISIETFQRGCLPTAFKRLELNPPHGASGGGQKEQKSIIQILNCTAGIQSTLAFISTIPELFSAIFTKFSTNLHGRYFHKKVQVTPFHKKSQTSQIQLASFFSKTSTSFTLGNLSGPHFFGAETLIPACQRTCEVWVKHKGPFKQFPTKRK